MAPTILAIDDKQDNLVSEEIAQDIANVNQAANGMTDSMRG